MQSIQTKQLGLPQAIAIAQQNFESGQIEACKYLCDRILDTHPDQAMACHLSGLIAHQQKRPDDAVRLLEKSLCLEPNNIMFLANAVEVMRSAQQVERAITLGEKAVAVDPHSASTLSNLALAYYDNKQLDKAKELHSQVLELAPEHLPTLNNLGSIARDEKDLAKAQEYYRRVLNLHPSHHEARNNLATVMIEADDLDAAQNEISQLLAGLPNYTEAVRNQARIHLARLQLDAAESLFRRVIELDPELALAYLGLSQVLLEKNHPDLALTMAETAAKKDPKNASCLHQLGLCHSSLANTEKAREFYDYALEINSEHSASLMGRGHLHMEVGELELARQDFEQAQKLDEEDISPLIALSRLDKICDRDNPIFVSLKSKLPEADQMSTAKQISYRFGLAECLHNLGQYDDAWTQYAKGAALKRSTIQYDADARDQQVDHIIEIFTPNLIEQLRAFAISSIKPIFILGMPRSGTTLTESILASHSDVFGAGELHDLQNVFSFDIPDPALSFPANLQCLQGEELTARALEYVTRLDAHSAQASRVTDKMPSNFNLVGLIHALLPNARIIHVQRNPMDTCLSCFTRLFERSQYQSYDQVELGRYYNGYRRLMTHWEDVLPKGAVYTLDYQELVGNTESQARALIEYCGLDWDPNCLEFHKSNRKVRTASITQVRQPIYQSSVEKWRRYESYLSSLQATIEA